jgi:hypothetical protein
MRVDRYDYWLEPPPEPSPKLAEWVSKIDRGWRPNRRIRTMGYDESAEFYGVYIWEYLNVISPLIAEQAESPTLDAPAG